MEWKRAKIVLLALAVTLSLGTIALAMENEYLKVEADGKGLKLVSKTGGAVVELGLVDKKGKAKGKLGPGDVKLSPDKNFIEVAPNGEAVEVRIKARFAFIPEFYAFEALYDPTLCKMDLLYVPAENFLIAVAEGGKSGVMFVWPSGGKQIPMLVAEGKGADRRFTKMRVTFDGKPVYVALFDHKEEIFPYITGLDKEGLAYDKKVSGTRPYKYAEVKSGRKFPFDAMWWTIIAKPHPLAISIPYSAKDRRMSTNLTIDFPVVSGMASKTWLTRSPGKRWNDVKNTYRRPAAQHAGREWVIEIEERFKPYYAALAYPRTRGPGKKSDNEMYPATPAEFLTVTDVIFHTLGKEAYGKAVGREGMRNRGCAPKGKPKTMATCGGSWGLFRHSGWDTDRHQPRQSNKEKFYYMTEALYHFVTHGMKRVKEYRDVAKEIIQMSKDAAKKNSKLKATVKKLITVAEAMEGLYEKETHHYNETVVAKRKQNTNKKLGAHTFTLYSFLSDEEIKNISLDDFLRSDTPGAAEKLRKWCEGIFDKYAEKDPATMGKLYGITRFMWAETGGRMDGLLESQRDCAKIIRQQAALIAVNSPEEREFALKVRQKALDVLKYYHYKESLPRAQLTAERLDKYKGW